ncbi:leader peptide SpeFL [Yersinia kristensenii]|nr:leader peptide SpeFL [Yersinia kristensenii]
MEHIRRTTHLMMPAHRSYFNFSYYHYR